MAKINFNLKKCSPEFRDGFLAALDFFDGCPQGKKCISHDFTAKDKSVTGITLDDGSDNDNATYKIRRKKIVFDSTGVER